MLVRRLGSRIRMKRQGCIRPTLGAICAAARKCPTNASSSGSGRKCRMSRRLGITRYTAAISCGVKSLMLASHLMIECYPKIQAVNGAERNVSLERGRAIALASAGWGHANHTRMGHRHDVAAVAAAHVVQPAFPARRDHLCRFSAAGPITPKVLRPGINLLLRYRIPSHALPEPEVHLDQVLCRCWL